MKKTQTSLEQQRQLLPDRHFIPVECNTRGLHLVEASPVCLRAVQTNGFSVIAVYFGLAEGCV